MKKPIKTIAIWGIIGVFLSSCVKKEIDDITLEKQSLTVAAPILNTDLTLENMVEAQQSDLDITTDSEGFITFNYFQNIISGNATDYISFQDQSFSESQSIPTLGNNFPTFTRTIEDTLDLAVSSGQLLDQVILKAGNLGIQASHTLTHDVTATISFPTILDNNSPLSIVLDLSFPGNTSVNNNTDMTGFDINLTAGGTSNNKIPYVIVMTIESDSPGGTLGTESINFDFSITNAEYSYMEGYLGQFNIDFNPDTVEIEIFDNKLEGQIFFSDPRVHFYFENSFGIPIEAQANSLIAVDQDGSESTITGTYDDTPIVINHPTVVGASASTEYTISEANTDNFIQIFNPTPNKMVFDVTTSTNPSGSGTNFVTDTSKLEINAEAEVPMEGYILGYSLADTIELETGDIPDTADITGWDEAEEVVVKIKTENGFPIDARVQGYVYDVNDVLLDSVFYDNDFDNIAQAGEVNSEGKVVASKTSFLEVKFDKDRYLKIIDAAKIVIMGTMETTGNESSTPIKIYNSYFINIDVGVKVSGTIDWNSTDITD